MRFAFAVALLLAGCSTSKADPLDQQVFVNQSVVGYLHWYDGPGFQLDAASFGKTIDQVDRHKMVCLASYAFEQASPEDRDRLDRAARGESPMTVREYRSTWDRINKNVDIQKELDACGMKSIDEIYR